MLTMCLLGLIGGASWLAIPGGAVVLLWLSDRGQHRRLGDRFQRLGREYVLTLSIGASLLNNAFFCALAYIVGMIVRWHWW